VTSWRGRAGPRAGRGRTPLAGALAQRMPGSCGWPRPSMPFKRNAARHRPASRDRTATTRHGWPALRPALGRREPVSRSRTPFCLTIRERPADRNPSPNQSVSWFDSRGKGY